MDVYVIAKIGGDPWTTQRTAVAKGGGRNPAWNFPMKFTIVSEKPHHGQRRYSSNYNNHIMLTFKIRSKRLLGDRDIGEVHVPVEDLLVNAGDLKHINFVSYQVRRRCGIPKGMLNFSYRFGEKGVDSHVVPITNVNESVLAYPQAMNTMYPPGRDAGGHYPPPPVQPDRPGGYPARMDGFGYQPIGPSYGHPSYSGDGYPMNSGHGHWNGHQGHGNSGLGMGMGVGLVGGALGGMLLGDMMSNAAHDYGHGGAMGNGDGFDF
ncbi:hypothetical protein Sjap_006800 [Stephania japonica]|uniref:C2 domain-containing protein n=1 Tax=Stephania japonica TaxID=461633 RepID=A0AAP0K8X4_9MAGN